MFANIEAIDLVGPLASPITPPKLFDTKPTTFDELVRISGLSHGTDVWINNAQTLVQEGTATLKEAICCRDDIMLYLISMGLPEKSDICGAEKVNVTRVWHLLRDFRMKVNAWETMKIRCWYRP